MGRSLQELGSTKPYKNSCERGMGKKRRETLAAWRPDVAAFAIMHVLLLWTLPLD
jgi:hypothetical protein